MAVYKVVRERVKIKTEGYVDVDLQDVQVLYKRTMRRWKEVDREIIPSHVMISLGTVGDTGGWTSKFSTIIDIQREKGHVDEDDLLKNVMEINH